MPHLFSLAVLDILMLRQRPGQSVIEYVHFMRQSFDDYNETCHLYAHNMGLLVFRGISSSRHYGHAKQCTINALDTNYLL
jgi:hypothetical protein